MVQEKSNTSNGYSKVIQILNDIQGSQVPDYQGLHAFWLNVDTFKKAVLYGQRLIAPTTDNVSPTDIKKKGGGCCGKNETDTQTETATPLNTTHQQPHDSNCWPTGGHGTDPISPNNARSEQSAIIKGLRGEYPFDHSIFPPLLWDAKRRATDAEIRIIAQWIDNGCTDDVVDVPLSTSSPLKSNDIFALACGAIPHKVSTNSTNVDSDRVKGLSVRKEISTLTETELKRLRDAIHCMNQYNEFWQDERSFNHWARIHTNSCQHGWEQFLPWHRAYLYFFEQTLQDYDANITLPYWSWADYSDVNKTSFNNTEHDLGVIPVAYRCWLTDAGLSVLKNTKSLDTGKELFSNKEIAGLEHVTQSGKTFNSGLRFLKAANIEYSLIKDPNNGEAAWSQKTRAIYDVLKKINPLWFPNRWPGSMGPLSSYPTKESIQNIYALSNWPDFGGGPEYDHHFGALEQVHNGMHNFSGGQNPCFPSSGNSVWLEKYKNLGITQIDQQNIDNPPSGWMTDNRITAYDPLFWAHHSNVDRIWARWQELHPNTNPEDTNGVLAPWPMTVSDTYSTKKLGYEYMRDSFHYNTESHVALTKFNSEKAGIKQSVLDQHRKAEIRLHRVQRGNMLNCSVRIFLNAPDANVQTSVENNDNYVGEVTTFHGTCYGGPGHCALPLDKTRQADQRLLHHHEPRNYRVDASHAVQKQLAKGETDISVHLVVVGSNGEPIDNALFIDGVSLNFFD